MSSDIVGLSSAGGTRRKVMMLKRLSPQAFEDRHREAAFWDGGGSVGRRLQQQP